MQYALAPLARVRGKCASNLHDLAATKGFGNGPLRGRLVCKECARLFGAAYDCEWHEADIEILKLDYELTAACICGGPNCGTNARAFYTKLYPHLASRLFA